MATCLLFKLSYLMLWIVFYFVTRTSKRTTHQQKVCSLVKVWKLTTMELKNTTHKRVIIIRLSHLNISIYNTNHIASLWIDVIKWNWEMLNAHDSLPHDIDRTCFKSASHNLLRFYSISQINPPDLTLLSFRITK